MTAKLKRGGISEQDPKLSSDRISHFQGQDSINRDLYDIYY